MNKNITTSTANEIKSHVQLIQSVMKEVMIENEHYGMIPGTNKNTLFQTGAQKLLATFRLGSDMEVVHTEEKEFSVSYRVKVRLFNIADGNTVGYGIGECSSLEDKYAFRKAVNDAEFDSYREDRRRVKHYQPYNKTAYSTKQVATNHKDVSNTILKMAYKRALVSATLTATAAGDIFTQDLEDMEPQTRESILDAELLPPSEKPKSTSNASLQEIRDAVSILSYNTRDNEAKKLGTMIKEADGKSLLIVTGNPYEKRVLLESMGFKSHKPQGSQYWETYMDVTHLVEASNPLGKPEPQSAPTTFKELDDRVAKLGLALDMVTIDGSQFAEAIGTDVYDKKKELKTLGFKWSNDDSKSWRFDLSVFNDSPPVSKPKMDLKKISAQAEVFGYTLSAPALSGKGESWVQAIPMDEHGDGASLVNNLGFKFFLRKNVYALKVS